MVFKNGEIVDKSVGAKAKADFAKNAGEPALRENGLSGGGVSLPSFLS